MKHAEKINALKEASDRATVFATQAENAFVNPALLAIYYELRALRLLTDVLADE